ncbi:MAG: F0F1 ATP synthase subunit gamma [Bacteroidaceae bacterium]|nr:F0F1 ATP synthase subunit gamma [Bacteroidaceae bacterium]
MSLKEIKTRIQSVQNTRKITSAMKMVASAKLHRAQEAISNMLPYQTMLYGILSRFLAEGESVQTEYQTEREVRNVALIVFSSNSSLCGAFNSNMMKRFTEVAKQYEQTLGKEHIMVYPIGRKIADYVKKTGYTPQGDFTRLADRPDYAQVQAIADELMQMFRKGKVDRVDLLYNHFKNTATQIYMYEPLLPLDVESCLNDTSLQKKPAATASGDTSSLNDANRDNQDDNIKSNYIVEPSVEELLGSLLPKVVRLKLFTSLLDSNASEHGARTMAMQIATDNADDLLNELSILYNKTRQQAITSELLDIVGGSFK